MLRLFWLTLGFTALTLGVLGIVLPLLPTTPFILLAAASFANSSTKFYNILINNRFFGPIIKNWRDKRKIPLKTIAYSLILMLVSIFISLKLITK